MDSGFIANIQGTKGLNSFRLAFVKMNFFSLRFYVFILFDNVTFINLLIQSYSLIFAHFYRFIKFIILNLTFSNNMKAF